MSLQIVEGYNRRYLKNFYGMLANRHIFAPHYVGFIFMIVLEYLLIMKKVGLLS